MNRLQVKKIKHKARVIYRLANWKSKGSLNIVVYAVKTFSDTYAAEAAAAVAYYALFSMFPLLLFFITIGSTILKDERFIEEVMRLAGQALPNSQILVEKNIQQVLELRGTVSIIATLSLLWAATTVFTILAHNINLPWHGAKPHSVISSRLLGLMMVGIMALFIFLSLTSATLFSLLPAIDFEGQLWGDVVIYETISWSILSNLLPSFFIFMMFVALYRQVPTIKVRWSEAMWGAVVATIAWEITKSAFTWFVSSGFNTYQLIYGSLGTVVALMLWIYLGSAIILFGAHLGASIAYHTRLKWDDSDALSIKKL